MTGVEEIKEFLRTSQWVDAGITVRAYTNGDPSALAYADFLVELGLVDGEEFKAGCERIKKQHFIGRITSGAFVNIRLTDDGVLQVALVGSGGEQTHYFNPETKELLRLI